MDYYERYWKGKKDQDGILNIPPEWEEKDIKEKIDLFRPFIGKRILDTGCGDCTFANELSKLSDVTGLEVSDTAIKIAKNKFPKIKVKCGNVTNIPLPEEKFDTLFAIELVEHILDTEKMFKEFNRVLKPGGFLCITTSQMTFLKNIFISMFMYDRFYFPTNPHIRFYTKKTLRTILERHGFEIIKYKKNGAYLGIIPKGQIVIAKKIDY